MGRTLDALKHRGPRQDWAPEPPREPDGTPAEAEGVAGEVPFIEVGGPRTSVEASPQVASFAARRKDASTAPPPRIAPPLGPEPAEAEPRPAAGDPLTGSFLTVTFKPLPASPAPARGRFHPQLVAYHQPDHPAGLAFQAILAAIDGQLAGVRRPALLFTGARPGSGTTTVLLNLAVHACAGGKTAAVVDAAIRRPGVAALLGLPEAPGLAQVLSGAVALDAALQHTAQAKLEALTAGQIPGVASSPVGADELTPLVRRLGEQFDLVFVDWPDWETGPETCWLGDVVDAAYLVMNEEEAKASAGGDLVIRMVRRGLPARGCILTRR